jgi:hypothetical protein
MFEVLELRFISGKTRYGTVVTTKVFTRPTKTGNCLSYAAGIIRLRQKTDRRTRKRRYQLGSSKKIIRRNVPFSYSCFLSLFFTSMRQSRKMLDPRGGTKYQVLNALQRISSETQKEKIRPVDSSYRKKWLTCIRLLTRFFFFLNWTAIQCTQHVIEIDSVLCYGRELLCISRI